MDEGAVGQCLLKDDMCSLLNIYHGVAVGIQTLLGGQIAPHQVGCGDGLLVHHIGSVHVVDEVRACDGVAVGIAELVYALQAASLQKLVNGVIVGQEAGIAAIGGKQVHQVGTLHNRPDFAVAGTVGHVVANHLTRERVEILAVGLVGTGGQCYTQ